MIYKSMGFTMGSCKIQLITAGKGCIKCQTAKKKINSVLENFKGKIKVEELDITKDPSVLGKFNIMATPSLAINNKLLFEGSVDEDKLKKEIERCLG
jgi:thioredoxin-like negative regulator of GroEL